nr:EOG090X09NT [Eulimnadia texana]
MKVSPTEQRIPGSNPFGSMKKIQTFRITVHLVLTASTGYLTACGVTIPSILLLGKIYTGTTNFARNSERKGAKARQTPSTSFFEVPFDSQMARTSNRVLVRGLISPLHAVSFATVSGTTGLAMLYFGVNSICAALGALTLVLYTLVYTPMKRTSIANTWVGSVVGALPPLMGYAGCTGYLDAGALVLASVLYAWQFPHFNALSWNLRGDYSRAGYRMMAVTDPELCRKTTLRYSLAMIGICSAAPLVNLTSWSFALDSLPVNLYLVLLSYRFYQNSDSSSSRKLFRYSLLHLPAIMMLMLLHKKKDDDSQDKLLKTIVNYLISNE